MTCLLFPFNVASIRQGERVPTGTALDRVKGTSPPWAGGLSCGATMVLVASSTTVG